MYQTDIEILVNGKPVKKYSHEGRTYIQAHKGSKYSIKIKNNSWNRRLFIVSVDGINVIDGKAAGSTDQGYVINGYSSYEVSGFRTSNEEIHPFKFNDKTKSYAAKSDETGGDVSSCGVIGIKVYDEKVKPYVINQPVIIRERVVENPYNPWRNVPDITWTCNTSATPNLSANLSSKTVQANFMVSNEPTYACKIDNSIPIMDMATETFQAGTEFSKEAIQDKVTETSFEIGLLVYTYEIFYDYREGLANLGVPLIKEAKITMPQAFPSRFCKPPKD